MKYTNPLIRNIARRISILCAIYFALFTFLYLYVLERDILAQTQFQLSEGTTLYHPLLAALLCTSLLTLLGSFLGLLFQWLPLRMKASAWFLPFELVGGLSHWCFPQFGDASNPPSWGSLLAILFVYLLWLLVVRQFPDSAKEKENFVTYAWPNALQLILCTMLTVGISNTDAHLHHTLAAGRYLSEGRYGRALHEARWEEQPSRQLTAITALCLSETGQLGERLFAYPQPYGSEGLLPRLSDTLMVYNLPLMAGHHLGYKKGDQTATTVFLQVLSGMPKTRPAARDYLLCAHLLDRNLEDFVQAVKDNELVLDSLPRHYSEALILYQHTYPEKAPIYTNDSLALCFEVFQDMLHEKGTKAEREFEVRHHFGASYWTYFYFN